MRLFIDLVRNKVQLTTDDEHLEAGRELWAVLKAIAENYKLLYTDKYHEQVVKKILKMSFETNNLRYLLGLIDYTLLVKMRRSE